MIDYLCLSKTTVTSETVSYVKDIDLSLIASLLGLNLDEETGILYKGNDKTNGFLFDIVSSENNLIIQHVVNGSTISSNKSTTTCSGSYCAYLYFAKTDNGCVFGTNTAAGQPKINYGVGTATKADGSKVNCYLSSQTTSDNSYVVASENGTYSKEGALFVNNEKIVSLAPAICAGENAVLDNFFIPYCFNRNLNTQEFEISGSKYISFAYYSTYNTQRRFVFKE